jgi:YD repeat-containing protein
MRSNAAGRLTSVTNPLLETTAYTYSLAGLLKLITHPDTTSVQKKYDELGRLIERIAPN